MQFQEFITKANDAIATIDEGMLQRTWQEIEHRLDVPRATNSAHKGVSNETEKELKYIRLIW